MKKTIVLLIISLLLVGCTQSTPVIYVTSYPIEYITQRIVGENVIVENISQGTYAPQATINKDSLEKMTSEDVLFRTGQLEPYMDLYTGLIEEKGVQIIDLNADLALNSYRENTNTFFFENGSLLGQDAYRQDTYSWLDPMVLNSISKTIYDFLITELPDREEEFKENYEVLKLDLSVLDAEYQELNRATRTIKLTSNTPAFNLWSQSYNIDVYALVLSRFGAIPTREQLASIIEIIENENVHYMVIEDGLPPDMLELTMRVSRENFLINIQLHNLFALSESDRLANRDYFTIMCDNLNTLLALIEE